MSRQKPFFSIIIPAHNEENYLPETLSTLRSSLKKIEESYEIIVVDNNSTDSTAKIARKFKTKLVSEEERKIARVRNRGAREAKGDWIIFLDADSLLEEQLLKKILEHIHSGEIIGGGALVDFSGPAPLPARWGLAGWNFISRTLKLAAGSLVFVKTGVLKSSGGFNESVYASEEIWLSRKLHREARKRGKKFVIITEYSIRTSPRKFHRFSTFQQLRWLGMFLLAPWLIFSKKACKKFWYENDTEDNNCKM